jgi:hypothetical protein
MYYCLTNIAHFWGVFHIYVASLQMIFSIDLPPCGFNVHRLATSQQTTGHSKALGQFLKDHLQFASFRDQILAKI